VRGVRQAESAGDTIEDSATSWWQMRHVPLGVVGASGVDFRWQLAMWKCAALLAGNTMVLKPSPFTRC